MIDHPESGADASAPLIAPTSFAQEVLYHLDAASAGMTAYNVPRAFELTGELDVDALRCALDGLVARHEVLRTTYEVRDGHVMQVVWPERAAELAVEDLAGSAPDAARDAADARVAALAREPFDLARDLMLRAVVLRTTPRSHVLFLMTHHIASDGWSGGVMLRDLAELYSAAREGRAPLLADLPLQYADFAAWQREQLQGPELERLLAHWRSELGDVTDGLTLPTDRPRTSSRGFAGDRVSRLVPLPVLERLLAIAQRHEATLYMAVLAGYQALLHRHSGQEDVVVGSPIAGRAHADTEGVLGYFANTLALRGRFADDPSFDRLLARTRQTCLAAYEHQDVPLEKLAMELRGGTLSAAPLFQVVLTKLDGDGVTFQLPGLEVRPSRLAHGTTKFDLTLFMRQRPDGLFLSLHYSTELFDAGTAARFLEQLEHLLTAAAADPSVPVSRLPLLSAADRAGLLAASTGPAANVPAITIHSAIERHARQSADRVAIVSGADRLTYAELNTRANQLAHRLRALGAGDEPVGLCLDRSLDAIVAMVAILKTGSAYLPLLPELPAERLRGQMREAGVRLVVTRRAFLEAVSVDDVTSVCLDRDARQLSVESNLNLPSLAGPDALAYVLFTSGSTGTPKGVAVTHRNAVSYASAIGDVLGIDYASDARALHFATVTSLGSDLGNTSIFPSLLSGGCLHLIATDVSSDSSLYADYVASRPVDILKITPTHLRALMEGPSGAAVLPTRALVLGGEACSWDLVDRVRATGRCRVLNHYGPTETTVGACTFELGATDLGALRPATVPIGRPLGGYRAYVLDANGAHSPLGVPGELYIGGAGVSRGYVNQPGLTAERFVPDPFGTTGAERMYRTGDRVRRLATGDLEFLGRTDDQVKVRGYRVEPGEVAAVIERVPGVRQAAVVWRDDAPGGPGLVAYVVAGDTAELRTAAERALPDYMVPAAFVTVPALPRTANGKLDRRALPAPAPTVLEAETFVAPRNPMEAEIAGIWAEVLKRERVGVTQSFMDLGGHSLTAIRVLGRLNRSFGVRLALRTLFDAPTVAGLAAAVLAAGGQPSPGPSTMTSRIVPVSRDGYRRGPG